MKIEMGDGRVAIIGVQFGTEQPLSKTGNARPSTGLFRSVRMTVSLFTADNAEIGSVTGISYCSPQDQFVRATGRMLAMRNLMSNDLNHRVLSVSDRVKLCPIMLTGRRQ